MRKMNRGLVQGAVLALLLVASAADASTHFAIITNLANAPHSQVSFDVASTSAPSALLSATIYPGGREIFIPIPDLANGFATTTWPISGNDDILARVAQSDLTQDVPLVVTARQREAGHNTLVTAPPIEQAQGFRFEAAVGPSGTPYLIVAAPNGPATFNFSFTPPSGNQTSGSGSVALARVQRIPLPSGSGGLATILVASGEPVIAYLAIDDGKVDVTPLFPVQ